MLHLSKDKRVFNICLIIVLGFMFLTMYYADLTVTSQFSMTLLDSLFDGKYASFYNNCLATGVAPEGAVYDVGIYIVFAILGLPVWILTKVTQISVLSVGCQLWFKLIILAFFLLEIKLTVDIATKAGIVSERSTEELSYLLLLSQLAVFPVLVSAQYDVIPLCLFLLGIRFMQEDKKYPGILAFGFSITMKPIVLIGIAGVILFKEKNILKILASVALCFIPEFICKLIYFLNPNNTASNNDFFNDLMPRLFSTSILTESSGISIFVLGLVIVYAGVYLCKRSEFGILLLSQFAIWSVFTVFANPYPYWTIYLSPFITLMIFMAPKKKNIISVFALITELCLTVAMILNYSWVYGGKKTFGYLVLSSIYNKTNPDNIATVAGALRLFKADSFLPAFNAVALGGLISIACVATYGYKHHDDVQTEDTSEVLHEANLWIRLAVYAGMILICMFCLVRGIQ